MTPQTPPPAREIAFALAALDSRPTFDERMHDAARAVPKLHRDTLALAPVMLRSALFVARTGDRRAYPDYTALPAPAGYRVELLGDELRQDDERVLLCLLKQRAGGPVEHAISIAPRAFARAIGWPDAGHSVDKLRACIERLHRARVRVELPSGGVDLYSFVSDAHLDGPVWTVWLSQRLAQVFERPATYLAASERLGMRDGLTSWLYGAIKADACHAPLALADLRERSGLGAYSPKDFNRRLRASLDELLALGVIADYELRRGSVAVRKAPAAGAPTRH